VTRYSDNERITIDPKSSQLRTIGHGGQGRVYLFDDGTQPLAIKLIPNERNTFRRVKALRDTVERYNALHPPITTPKEHVTGRQWLALYRQAGLRGMSYRGLPIAQGFATPDAFGFSGVKSLSALAFRYVDGSPLDIALEEEPPLSVRRRQLSLQLVDILSMMQILKITHNDLYPDNFLVDAHNQLFLIDLEGAGIFHPDSDAPLFHPSAAGKQQLFPLAPEAMTTAQSLSQDVWIGAYLLFYTLCNFKPFDFLRQTSIRAIEEIALLANPDKPTWPPTFASAPSPRLFNPNFSLDKMREFMQYYFAGTRFEQLLFRTFIVGLRAPRSRPAIWIYKDPIVRATN